MNVKQYCYTTSYRVMQGLEQALKLKPGLHYHPSGYNAARVMTLRLAGINPHHLPAISGLRDQLSMWAGLDDKARIRIGWRGTTILLEIPKPPQYWKSVTIDSLERRHMLRRGPVVTLGLGLQDDPKRINFKEAAIAHIFVTGQTRSGKTNTQKLIGWNLARNTQPHDARLLIFDVAKRGYNWRDFNNSAHLAHPVIVDVNEAGRVLQWLTLEITRRAEQHYTKPKIFCLIDELKALTDDSPSASTHLARVASVGGEFGLHLILATQYPQVKMLGNAELKRNITTRLCGKVDDAAAAANALGISGTGAETLQGYGDFLLKDFDGLSRLTVAKIEQRHIDQLARAETSRLDLPEETGHITGPHPSIRKPDPLTPEQVAVALFEPMGNTRLGRRLGVGSGKAKRINHFAQRIRHWAQAHGHNCLEASNRTDITGQVRL